MALLLLGKGVWWAFVAIWLRRAGIMVSPGMPHGNVAGTASNSGAIFERVAFPVDYVACMVNARPRPEITNAPWPSGPSLIIIYF